MARRAQYVPGGCYSDAVSVQTRLGECRVVLTKDPSAPEACQLVPLNQLNASRWWSRMSYRTENEEHLQADSGQHLHTRIGSCLWFKGQRSAGVIFFSILQPG